MIRVNRAPVLTLWATVVAERLSFERGFARSECELQLLSAFKGATLTKLLEPGECRFTNSTGSPGGPPTVRLLSGAMGAERIGIMVAWITVIHQVGAAAAAAAYLGGERAVPVPISKRS